MSSSHLCLKSIPGSGFSFCYSSSEADDVFLGKFIEKRCIHCMLEEEDKGGIVLLDTTTVTYWYSFSGARWYRWRWLYVDSFDSFQWFSFHIQIVEMPQTTGGKHLPWVISSKAKGKHDIPNPWKRVESNQEMHFPPPTIQAASDALSGRMKWK